VLACATLHGATCEGLVDEENLAAHFDYALDNSELVRTGLASRQEGAPNGDGV